VYIYDILNAFIVLRIESYLVISIPMYFNVVFFRLYLLLSDFNMSDVPYSWHVSGASRPLSFV